MSEYILGKPGYGKAFFCKNEILKPMIEGVIYLEIDTEKVCTKLSENRVNNAIGCNQKINPFKISIESKESDNELNIKNLKEHLYEISKMRNLSW